MAVECPPFERTVFQPRFPAQPLSKYPGLSREDSRVVTRFLEGPDNEFDGASYNVRVGRGEPCPEGASQSLRRDVFAFSALRIDCVFVRPGEVMLVEAKPRMNMAAIGQLQAYGELFPDRFEFDGDLTLALVCERTTRDLTPVYATLGLLVFVV